MAKVRVVRGDNRTGFVDESQLPTALAQGWQVGTEEEAKAKKARREASGAVGSTIAAGEALARGATLGLSDVALRRLGVEGGEVRREALGEGGVALEVAGAIAPTLLTGGTGAAATAARLTPTALAARGGAALTRGATARLGGGAAARVAGAAVGSGFEGALGGMGSAASEAALGDKDLSAEMLLAGGGSGAGLGAFIGGGATGLGLGLSATYRGTQRVSKDLIGKALGAGDSLPGAAKADGLMGAAARKQVEGLSRVAGLADDAVADNVAAMDRVLGRTRSKQGRRLLELARGPSSRVDDAVGEALAPTVKGAGAGKAVRSWGKKLEAQASGRKMLAARAKEAEAALKGAQGKDAAKLRKLLRAESRGVPDLAAYEKGRARMQRTLDAMRDAGDPALERAQAAVKDYFDGGRDPLVFGKGIEARDAVIAGQRAEKEALEALSPKARASLTGGEVDAKALGSADPETIGRVLDARSSVADALEGVGEDVSEVRRGLDDVRKALRLRDDVADAAGDVGKLEALEKTPGGTVRSGLETAGEVGGAILGGLSFGGGVIGKALGSVAGLATRPASAARVVARVRGGIDAVVARQGRAVAAFANLADKGAKAAGKAARGTGRAAARVAPSVARKAQHKRREKIAAVAARVGRLAADPSALAADLDEDLLELRDAAPGVASRVVMGSARATAYLASQIPPMYEPMFSGEKLADPYALDAFGRKVDAVIDPLGTMDLLGSGALTRDHVEAIAAVYPKMYERLRSDVLDVVGERSKPGGEGISYAARMQLGLLTDTVTDDSLRPEVYAAIQSSMGPAAEQAQEQMQPMSEAATDRISDPPKSQWQRMESGS